MLKLDEPLRKFLVDILPPGSGSVDPHIFADPDPGSQNLADPTDPDSKHCSELLYVQEYPNLEMYCTNFEKLPAIEKYMQSDILYA